MAGEPSASALLSCRALCCSTTATSLLVVCWSFMWRRTCGEAGSGASGKAPPGVAARRKARGRPGWARIQCRVETRMNGQTDGETSEGGWRGAAKSGTEIDRQLSVNWNQQTNRPVKQQPESIVKTKTRVQAHTMVEPPPALLPAASSCGRRALQLPLQPAGVPCQNARWSSTRHQCFIKLSGAIMVSTHAPPESDRRECAFRPRRTVSSTFGGCRHAELHAEPPPANSSHR